MSVFYKWTSNFKSNKNISSSEPQLCFRQSFFKIISLNRCLEFDTLDDFTSEINALTGIGKYLLTFDYFMDNIK